MGVDDTIKAMMIHMPFDQVQALVATHLKSVSLVPRVDHTGHPTDLFIYIETDFGVFKRHHANNAARQVQQVHHHPHASSTPAPSKRRTNSASRLQASPPPEPEPNPPEYPLQVTRIVERAPLVDKRFYVRNVLGDGSCFYRSVHKALTFHGLLDAMRPYVTLTLGRNRKTYHPRLEDEDAFVWAMRTVVSTSPLFQRTVYSIYEHPDRSGWPNWLLQRFPSNDSLKAVGKQGFYDYVQQKMRSTWVWSWPADIEVTMQLVHQATKWHIIRCGANISDIPVIGNVIDDGIVTLRVRHRPTNMYIYNQDNEHFKFLEPVRE
jgi:hypothetical protein